MTLTDLLRTEHSAFNTILEEIEAILPNTATLGELRILVRVMAAFLHEHGVKEEAFLYPALDHSRPNAGN